MTSHSKERPLQSQEKDGSGYSSSSYIYFSSHNAAHLLHTQWASSVNECYSVIYDTTSFQRGKKRIKRWKMPPVPQRPSQHQSARSLSSPGLFHSLPVCLLSDESEDFYTPPVFAYLWCEVPSWIPHSPQTGSQPAAVCVCSSCERKWLRAKHCHVRTAVDKLMKQGFELSMKGPHEVAGSQLQSASH